MRRSRHVFAGVDSAGLGYMLHPDVEFVLMWREAASLRRSSRMEWICDLADASVGNLEDSAWLRSKMVLMYVICTTDKSKRDTHWPLGIVGESSMQVTI